MKPTTTTSDVTWPTLDKRKESEVTNDPHQKMIKEDDPRRLPVPHSLPKEESIPKGITSNPITEKSKEPDNKPITNISV